MSGSDVCELLAWDSEFFGLRIGRVRAGVMTRELSAAIEAEAARARLDCLYFLADADQPGSVGLAEGAGFRLVDVRVELDLHFAPAADPTPGMPPLRLATPADAAILRAIARVSHRDSRFYQDGNFARERCDALYETWIDRSMQGWADAVLVAEQDGVAVGYITCSRRADGVGQIGLLGVEGRAHGAGHGTRLVRAALDWFQAAGCPRVIVVTQGRNVAAQRLYQRGGFKTSRMQLWWHRWFGAPHP
jgi:dTDP-4-amino-4,6-dideoxy-D-galactose acyltransferase